MMDDETGVAVARWDCEGRVDAIATVRHGVTGFARRHGMSAAIREQVGVAVSEVVGHVLRPGAEPRTTGRVVVDAATDGTWLSIRVAGDACGAAGADEVL